MPSIFTVSWLVPKRSNLGRWWTNRRWVKKLMTSVLLLKGRKALKRLPCNNWREKGERHQSHFPKHGATQDLIIPCWIIRLWCLSLRNQRESLTGSRKRIINGVVEVHLKNSAAAMRCTISCKYNVELRHLQWLSSRKRSRIRRDEI